MSSPFEVARAISNNLGKLQTNISDRSAIDEILSKQYSGADPATMQSDIASILKRVSPDRQQAVIGAVKAKHEQAAKTEQLSQRKATAKAYGLPESIAYMPDSTFNQALKGKMVGDKYDRERQEDIELSNRLNPQAQTPGNIAPQGQQAEQGGAGITPGVEGEQPLEEDEGIQLKGGGQISPKIQKQIDASIANTKGFDGKIDDLQREIDIINATPGLNQKKKNDFTKPKIQEQNNLRKTKENFVKPNKRSEKRLTDLEEEAVKAKRGIDTLDEVDALLNSNILPEEFSWTTPGAFIDKARRLVVKKPNETKFESLATDLLTQQFKTLPRIKSEFDAFVKANISLSNSAAGNRLISQRRREANELVIEADSIARQLTDQGVNPNKIPSLVDQIMNEEQDAFIKKLRAERGLTDKGSGAASGADVDKILFGK